MTNKEPFQLTHVQQMAVPVLMWMIDDGLTSGRATGRSTALAYAFIIKGVQNPNRQIEVWDHHPHFRSRSNMLHIISDLFNRTDFRKEYKIKLFKNDNSIMIEKKTAEEMLRVKDQIV